MVNAQAAMPLVEALRHCAQRDHAPFYTPGHKRGQGIHSALTDLLGDRLFRADLPELPDLDNLFAPEGCIRDAQTLAAAAFGADHTWFLANGSTCGIEAAVLATCRPGDPLIVPRNCHQSAIAALILSGAIPIFVDPAYNDDWQLPTNVTATDIEAALAAHPQAKAVLIVSPTYHGICADVGAIAQVAHRFNVPLIVDEAHGAHFRFHPDLPTSGLESGADIVIQSTHKVLGAMTQAAMLHCRGDRVPPDRIRRALQLVQSTSPSFLLLASLDAARHQMALNGHALMQQTVELANSARDRLTQIPGLRVLSAHQIDGMGCSDVDATRLTVDVTGLGLTGFEADERLHQQLNVTAELPGLRHLTFIVSLGNIQADIDRLVQGFQALAHTAMSSDHPPIPPIPRPDRLPLACSPREAFFAPTEIVPIAKASDRISAELICPYPPGIPVLFPGERVTEEAIAYLHQIKAAGGIISGCQDPDLATLSVIQ